MGLFDKLKRNSAEKQSETAAEKLETVIADIDEQKSGEAVEDVTSISGSGNSPYPNWKSLDKKERSLLYLRTLLNDMGLSGDFKVSEVKEGINVELADDPMAENGDFLDALQYLIATAVNRRDNNFFRVSLDCNGYRARRKAELEALADKFCRSVIKTGHSAAMVSMNAYERRIVHSKISDIHGVYSKSSGSEPNRKVVIYPTIKKASDLKSGGAGTRRQGRDRRDYKDYVPKPARPLDLTTSFERDYKKNQK